MLYNLVKNINFTIEVYSMKTVLITGGARGIGAQTVKLFSQSGYNVAFTFKESDEKAKELGDKFGALAIKANSCVEEDVIRAIEKTKETFGGVDILVNNAAVSSFGTIHDISLDEWNRVVSSCLTGAFLYTKYAISNMLKKKWGRIINISSMWGIVGSSCEAHYSAAKAGLIGFTKAMAKELGPSGITVNCIAPGVIDTDMNKGISEEDIYSLVNETPVGRIGKPEEISKCVLFLASEDASFITGDVMNASGGFIV